MFNDLGRTRDISVSVCELMIYFSYKSHIDCYHEATDPYVADVAFHLKFFQGHLSSYRTLQLLENIPPELDAPQLRRFVIASDYMECVQY